MKYIPVPVENNGRNILLQGCFGNVFTDGLCCIDIGSPVLEFVNGQRRRRSQRGAGIVVDDLGVDMLVRTEYHETRSLCGTENFLPNTDLSL